MPTRAPAQLSIRVHSINKSVMAATQKKSFALRIDEQVLEAIEKWAVDEFRSTNGQIEYLLVEALRKAKRMPKKKGNGTE